jgi:hypothetical protein
VKFPSLFPVLDVLFVRAKSGTARHYGKHVFDLAQGRKKGYDDPFEF